MLINRKVGRIPSTHHFLFFQQISFCWTSQIFKYQQKYLPIPRHFVWYIIFTSLFVSFLWWVEDLEVSLRLIYRLSISNCFQGAILVFRKVGKKVKFRFFTFHCVLLTRSSFLLVGTWTISGVLIHPFQLCPRGITVQVLGNL